MKVLICGGSKTDIICSHLAKHSEWDMLGVPAPNVVLAVQDIIQSGMKVDRIFMLGEALENLTAEAREAVFNYMADIVDEFNGDSEFIFVNKNNKNIDFKSLYSKYLSNQSRARFVPIQDIALGSLDKIIKGSEKIREDSKYILIKKSYAERCNIKTTQEVYGIKVESKPEKPDVNSQNDPELFSEPYDEMEDDGPDEDDERYGEYEEELEEDLIEEDYEDDDDHDLADNKESYKKGFQKNKQAKKEVPAKKKTGSLFGFGKQVSKPEKPNKAIRLDKDDEVAGTSAKEVKIKDKSTKPSKLRSNDKEVVKEPVKMKEKAGKLSGLFSAAKNAVNKRPDNDECEDIEGFVDEVDMPEIPRQTKQSVNLGKVNKASTNEYHKPGLKFKPPKGEIEQISRRHRVIMVTGNERSGKSGIAANLGMIASMCGLRTLIIDLDVYGRGQSLYYQSQLNPEDSHHTAGLMNAVRTPYKISGYTIPVTDYLDILGIDITVADVRTIYDSLSGSNISELLGHTRDLYDIVIIDMPFKDMSKFGSLIGSIDRVVFTTENDIPSMVSIVNKFNPEMFSNMNEYQLFRSKCGFVINNYNPCSTSEENLIEPANFVLFLDDLVYGHDFYRYPVFGAIEHIPNYVKQFDGGYMLSESKGYDFVFFNILNCLCK